MTDFSRLLPGETLIRSLPAPMPSPAQLPDARMELARLTGVSRPDDIGAHGPPISSLPLETGSQAEYLRLFEAVFGRDSLMISLGLADEFPRLAEATVTYLAEQQGLPRELAPDPDQYDRRGEAAGRIAHEIRNPDDPVARRLSEHNGWGWPYYGGQVDANDLFVLAIARLAETDEDILDRAFTGRDGRKRTLGEAMASAFFWATSQTENPEGFIECERVGSSPSPERQQHGLVAYPTWQDSPDSTMRADGSLATGAVALAELQANRFSSLQAMAELCRRRPDLQELIDASPPELDRRLERLRRSLLTHLWGVPGSGLPRIAFGTERMPDGSLSPLWVRKSNPGHLLNCGILEGPEYREPAAQLVGQLMDPDEGLICPSGIRTLSSHERLFRPCAYHNGTVWLWDTAWVGLGLLRHRYHRCADLLFSRVIEVCRELRYYPEHVRGLDSTQPSVNDHITVVESHDPHFGAWPNQVEQPPQVVQGWTVMAFLVASREQSRPVQARPLAPREVDDLDAELAAAVKDTVFSEGAGEI
jgi:glycogen debranching enzyme